MRIQAKVTEATQLEALWSHDAHTVREALFALIASGPGTRNSPLHTLTLATMGLDHLPAARTVVFRAVDLDERRVRVHSDIRSPKIAELRAQPEAVLLWYAAAWKLQLRVAARFAIHHGDDVAAQAWEQTHVRSRRVYNTPHAPGTRSLIPLSDIAPHLEALPATAANTAPGFANFAVLVGQFDRIEWLTLSAQGNRRGELHWDGQQWDAGWLAP